MTDEIAKALDLTPLVPDKKEIRSIKGANEYETAKKFQQQVVDIPDDLKQIILTYTMVLPLVMVMLLLNLLSKKI